MSPRTKIGVKMGVNPGSPKITPLRAITTSKAMPGIADDIHGLNPPPLWKVHPRSIYLPMKI